MNPYQYKPLEGLLNIKLEEISNADIVSVFDYVEKSINASPKGRAKELALLFYLINILNKSKLPFYVKGGIVNQYYLKEKARPTKDLDLLTPLSGEEFYHSLDNYLSNIDDPFTFKITKFKSIPADEHYYYDTFNIEIVVYYNHQAYSTLTIDAVSVRFFDEIQPLKYRGPSFIEDHFTFLGVPKEYVLAEKITAITNELKRPYKHLVDVYGYIHGDIAINLLKKYLLIICNNDNQIRKSLNKETKNYLYHINEDKVFAGSYFLPTLQVGYTETFEEMKKEVNDWLDTNL